MDDWSKTLQAALQKAARDSSNWFAEVSEQTNATIEQFSDATNQAIEDIDALMEPTLTAWGEQIDQSLDEGIVYLEQVVGPQIEAAIAPITQTVTPWVQNHPACIGCRHYQGSAYGGHMLVCGMYPYGPEGERCPDWEAIWAGSGE